jgi:hypothetical protein
VGDLILLPTALSVKRQVLKGFFVNDSWLGKPLDVRLNRFKEEVELIRGYMTLGFRIRMDGKGDFWPYEWTKQNEGGRLRWP